MRQNSLTVISIGLEVTLSKKRANHKVHYYMNLPNTFESYCNRGGLKEVCEDCHNPFFTNLIQYMHLKRFLCSCFHQYTFLPVNIWTVPALCFSSIDLLFSCHPKTISLYSHLCICSNMF